MTAPSASLRHLTMFTALAVASAGAVIAGTGFDISTFTVDSSGGTSTSPSFAVAGTIGQHDATPTLTSASFELTGGFWADGEELAEPCPWDCAPSGGNGNVNIDDLLAVINAFGMTDSPCDNAPDNGDGTFGNNIINIDDLLGVINNFGACP
ncbi:MAG: hypothetical protein AAF432_11195 [Planctomycetota bacterium]